MNRINRPCFQVYFALLLLAAFALSGCAAPKTATREAEKVFYPEPPELPRLQFLTSLNGAKDIEDSPSALDTFLAGGETARGNLKKPYGVGIHDGKIYVADSVETVKVFDLVNKKFHNLKGAKGLGKLVQPINLWIQPDGTKFVADPVRNQVIMYDAKDFYVKSFSYPGKWKPTDMAAYDDRLYVVDGLNKEIAVFDISSGNFVKKFGKTTQDPEKDLGFPTNISIDPEGFLYITDVGRFQVVKYDRDGHYRMSFGKLGRSVGHFARPRDSAVDRQGRLLVVDAAFNNVQIFRTEDGQLLTFFGGSGKKPGSLDLPAGIAIDYDNIGLFAKYIDPNFEPDYLVIVTSQVGENRVNVYAFGKEKGAHYPSEDDLLEQQREKMEQIINRQQQ